MAEQRQPFRFRLPWLPAPVAPRPSPTPTPTPAQPAPTQSATAAPFLRPPFRPPGIVQVQPPPPPPQDQAQASPRTESQVQSPPLAAARSPPFAAARSPPFGAARSPVTSQPAPLAAARSPPFGAARSPVTSQPTSPARAAYQSQAGSLPSSPSRGPSQYAGPTSSQPTSPSRTATQVPPRSQVVSQPVSPSKRIQSSTQESYQAPPTYTRPQTLASGPEVIKPAVSQMQSQEPQTKAQITTEAPKSQDQNILGTTVQVAVPKAPAPPQKSDSSTFIGDGKPIREYDQRSEKTGQGKDDSLLAKVSQADRQEPQTKAEIPAWTLSTSRMAAQPSQVPGSVAAAAAAATETPSLPQKSAVWKPLPSAEETEEKKKVEQELKREEKTNGPAYETTKQRTEAERSKIQIKEQQTLTFPGVQKQPGKQEILDRKEILSTSGSSGKQSKMVISTHPKDRSPVSEPRPKPATFNGERAPLHKGIREDISKFVHKLTTGHPKQPMDEKPISITNLVGENRGASMHFVPQSAKKDASLHIHRGYKANTDEGGDETTTEGEGNSREDSMIKEVQATKAYINSNIQSINNSIFFDASVTERNPGVQLGISSTPTASEKFGHKEEPLEAHKAEFSVTPSQKLTYEPVIKRRCLRGLFLESSDSDPDNPEKPRRHGCRYSCGEKSEGNNTDVL